ncbi:MAG: hypothetical protein IJ165_04980 [Proteobacteria bacterium]|nr:hypothetical protein [Pseudomonadota bacterium]
MDGKKRSFYLFCAVIAGLLGLVVWGIVSMHEPEIESLEAELDTGKVEFDEPVPPALELMGRKHEKPQPETLSRFDETKLFDSLREGAIPTQDVGEKGSLEGALVTKYPLVYPETKYERLPNSPLIVFTDDMIWSTGENAYSVKRDAMRDQARTSQEASIALSISPQVEYEKTLGYRLVEIPEGTLFSKLGMVSGDVIVSINGTIPDMEPMALMFIQMVAGKQGASTIVVDHRGKKRTIQLSAVE